MKRSLTPLTSRVAVLLMLVLPVLVMPVSARADPYLLMAEEPGCIWCARWTEEIGPIYPKTPHGRAAPLQRYDLHRDDPGIALAGKVRFTPTFLLIKDGVELGRIEGYPGEDFFWGLLDVMFTRAGIPLDGNGG